MIVFNSKCLAPFRVVWPNGYDVMLCRERSPVRVPLGTEFPSFKEGLSSF